MDVDQEETLICRGCSVQVETDAVSLASPAIRQLYEKCTYLQLPRPEKDTLPKQLCSDCHKKCQSWLLFKTVCQDNEDQLENLYGSPEKEEPEQMYETNDGSTEEIHLALDEDSMDEEDGQGAAIATEYSADPVQSVTPEKSQHLGDLGEIPKEEQKGEDEDVKEATEPLIHKEDSAVNGMEKGEEGEVHETFCFHIRAQESTEELVEDVIMKNDESPEDLLSKTLPPAQELAMDKEQCLIKEETEGKSVPNISEPNSNPPVEFLGPSEDPELKVDEGGFPTNEDSINKPESTLEFSCESSELANNPAESLIGQENDGIQKEEVLVSTCPTVQSCEFLTITTDGQTVDSSANYKEQEEENEDEMNQTLNLSDYQLVEEEIEFVPFTTNDHETKHDTAYPETPIPNTNVISPENKPEPALKNSVKERRKASKSPLSKHTPWNCVICKKACQNYPKLCQHLETKHIKSSNDCTVCKIHFNTSAEAVAHVISSHMVRKWSCSFCRIGFNAREEYRQHISNVHFYYCSSEITVQGDLICPWCPKAKFADLTAFKTHTVLKHAEGKEDIICKVCSVPSENGKELLDHILSQHLSCQFACNNCDYTNPSLPELAEHLQKVHHVAMKSCTICGKGVKNMVEHMKHHKCKPKPVKSKSPSTKFLVGARRTYQCVECKLCFMSPFLLAGHQVSHSGKKDENTAPPKDVPKGREMEESTAKRPQRKRSLKKMWTNQ